MPTRSSHDLFSDIVPFPTMYDMSCPVQSAWCLLDDPVILFSICNFPLIQTTDDCDLSSQMIHVSASPQYDVRSAWCLLEANSRRISSLVEGEEAGCVKMAEERKLGERKTQTRKRHSVLGNKETIQGVVTGYGFIWSIKRFQEKWYFRIFFSICS